MKWFNKKDGGDSLGKISNEAVKDNDKLIVTIKDEVIKTIVPSDILAEVKGYIRARKYGCYYVFQMKYDYQIYSEDFKHVCECKLFKVNNDRAWFVEEDWPGGSGCIPERKDLLTGIFRYPNVIFGFYAKKEKIFSMKGDRLNSIYHKYRYDNETPFVSDMHIYAGTEKVFSFKFRGEIYVVDIKKKELICKFEGE